MQEGHNLFLEITDFKNVFEYLYENLNENFDWKKCIYYIFESI